MVSNCFCDTGLIFKNCCGKFIIEEKIPETAVALMRSRYTAYCLKEINYIIETTHPNYRKNYSEKSIRSWAEKCQFKSLKILSFTEKTVHFEAIYSDEKGKTHIHKEFSYFEKIEDKWFFTIGE